MNMNNLGYQFSVFGDYSSFEPAKIELLFSLIERFKKSATMFLPNTINQITPSGLIKRMQLINDEWQVTILNERVDVVSLQNKDVQDVKKCAVEILKTVLEVLDVPLVRRIALNYTETITTDQSETIGKIYSQIKEFNSFYKDRDLLEWTVRFNTQEKSDDYTMNIISNIAKMNGKIINMQNMTEMEIDGILVQYDINTVPNSDSSFAMDIVKSFFDKAFERLEGIKSSILSLGDDGSA
jgi:hypothetical protein